MHPNNDDEPFDRGPWRQLLARDGAEPPPAIDARIRTAARQAVRGALRRWILPASLAASALLAVVLLRQQEQQPQPVSRSADINAAITAQAPADAAKAATSGGVAEPAALPASPAPQESLADAAVTAAPAPASPEEWYARIEDLRSAGRNAEANAELAALERAYPGWLAARAAAPH